MTGIKRYGNSSRFHFRSRNNSIEFRGRIIVNIIFLFITKHKRRPRTHDFGLFKRFKIPGVFVRRAAGATKGALVPERRAALHAVLRNGWAKSSSAVARSSGRCLQHLSNSEVLDRARALSSVYSSRKDLKLSLQVPVGFNVGGADVVIKNCGKRLLTL